MSIIRTACIGMSVFRSSYKGHRMAEASILSHRIQLQVNYVLPGETRRAPGHGIFIALNTTPGFVFGHFTGFGWRFKRYA